MTGQTPPGWYPDPYGTPGLQRYWDGGQWTTNTQPAGGSGTPEPWRPPGGQQQWAQPSNPQGFPAPGGPASWPGGVPPQQRQRSQTGLWIALGGGLVAIVVLAAVVLLVLKLGDDDDPGRTLVSPTTSVAASKSPVVGTINDSRSGLSWAQLGGEWRIDDIGSKSATLAKIGLVTGQAAVVHQNYEPGQNYSATIYSAELPESVYYVSGNLENAAKSWFGSILPAFYPAEHTKQDVASRSYSVSGKKAWYYEVKLSFPQAESENWNFRSERVIMILVDRPGEQPAALYLSVPDSHKNLGDVDLVLGSLKAP